MTTLQRIRASRGEPCWPCFQAEFTGMYHRLRRAEDRSMNEPFPLEWVVQPCTWRINAASHTKCMYCSDKPTECIRVPALLEGNFKDLMDTIDYFRMIISARGGSPTGYALAGTAQTNVMKSLVKLAIAFDHIVNYHKDEHTMRGGTQEALKPHLEKYQLKFDKRRQDLATGVALQSHTYPDDGLVRLTRDDHEFYIWSSRVYEFYDDLASGLELGLVPEEAISIIVTHIPIVRPYASNPLPNAVLSELTTLMNRHWEELSMIGGDDHTNDQGGRADSGFRDRGRVTVSPKPPTKKEPACT
ncbi:hypothetical protein CEP51_006844 [Fusarium floridanum]|uniref:Uncharacterized protein n=1 Tax=Fusarium floridanum TaxID=1325733 RepID=A0A428RRH3_9HYPO|nr:hypothetical protein CEP51_006844 [Fusarium floridanum]